MKEKFIKIQLFGDPAGDPSASGNGPSGPDAQTPGADGDNAPSNAAKELIDFKKKFVSREKYEEAVRRGDEYLNAIMNNREEEIARAASGKDESVNPDEIARKLFCEDNNMSDIEYVQNALDLRDARIKAGERDPFLPDNYTDEDVEVAENVADVFRECIKVSDGDNGAFIALLQSRMKEAKILPKNNYRR